MKSKKWSKNLTIELASITWKRGWRGGLGRIKNQQKVLMIQILGLQRKNNGNKNDDNEEDDGDDN